tara:strand:+ start:1253 stop:1870 length:618 start_codon:yes stop_codon:yes gene_type:complete
MIGNHNNRTWYDRGALRYMRNNFGVDTMVDIGCGTKNQVKTALAIGYSEAIGIDGDEKVEPDIVSDFNDGLLKLDKNYDLAWCVEVLPYIHQRKIRNLKPALEKCKYLIATATVWSNREYPNGNKRQWYIDRFESWGFKYDDDLYKEVVEHSLMERKNHESGSYTWLERTGMVFKNTMLIGSQTESFEESESESVEEVEDGGTFE